MRLALLVLMLLGASWSGFAQAEPSLMGKHVVGYQGWFGCPDDGSGRGWFHWFRGGRPPSAATLATDLWPDMSELPEAERCRTGLLLPSGEEAKVFSSANEATVRRHFRWMREHDIDGAAVIRFVSQVSDETPRVWATRVLRNARRSAEAEGRGFFVMYDLSGQTPGSALRILSEDWARLAEQEQLFSSASYMRHHGKPVVGLWGLGVKRVQLDPAAAQQVIDFFKAKGMTVVGGVPTYWRTLTRDAHPEPEWKSVYASLDVISPWTVGRFRTPDDVAAFGRSVMMPDIAATRASGQDYMPVIFPGFSWFNLQQGRDPLDQIPRRCGGFYQAQVRSALASGARMLFTAMFDEVDEGTAIFKLEQNPRKLPIDARLVIPDLGSNCRGGSDLYLRLAGEATRAVRKNRSHPH